MPTSHRILKLQGAQKHNDNAKEEVVQKQALTKGSFCEFEEKKRHHVGKIVESEHVGSGNVRYTVQDPEGKSFKIAAKQIAFSCSAPANDKAAEKMLADFDAAMAASPKELRSALDVDAETLELAWEAAAEDPDHPLTAKSFIDLVHSRSPKSALETYQSWRLLCTDMSHVFFKALKDSGRVVSFKAKAASAVEAAKVTFCGKTENDDFSEDFCLV